MNKKGAIELSITTIIILILGITMLGLSLVFVTNIFSEGTEEFEKAIDVVDKQFIEQLKQTEKVIALDRPKLDIERSAADQIYIVFNNKNAFDKNFNIMASTSCSRLGSDASCDGVNIEYLTAAMNVAAGDVAVQPINFIVDATADKGTYVYGIDVNATTSIERIEVIIDVK